MKISCRSVVFALTFLLLAGLTSCEMLEKSGDPTGTAEFSISLPDNAKGSKSSAPEDTITIPYQLMISVEDIEGNQIFNDKKIPVYVFGTGLVSEKIEIKTGEYLLTSFMVIDANGAVVYASPRQGSEMAYLINYPLPLSFSINPDEATVIKPEVLETGDHLPGEFGYANFEVQIIKPLHFWTVCILDDPLFMPPAMYTSARLTVYAADGWYYTFDLNPELNHIIIRGGSDFYTFILEKDGFETTTMQVSAEELFRAVKENPYVLRIKWNQNLKTLELQPGPDDGQDALISDLDPDINFGDHPSFEATFLPETLLTVMRTNRSLIWFNTGLLPKSAIIKKAELRLSYDIPLPWPASMDSSITDPILPQYEGAFQQVLSPWEESEVTWNSQPETSEFNQVIIFPYILNTNFIDIDVTPLYVSSDGVSVSDYGMLFRLFPAEDFPGFRFASSDHPDSLLRPKLTLYYTEQ